MILDSNFTALVIIGGWNKHIFTADWLKRYLFPEEHDGLLVNSRADLRPRPDIKVTSFQISSKNVSISWLGNRLYLTPVQNEVKDAARIEEVAMQLADYLPHTPVSGFNVNFGYTDDDFDENLSDSLRPSDTAEIIAAGATLEDEHYRRRLKINGRILDLSIGISGTELILHFSFHFDIPDLANFKSKITDYPIQSLKQEAVDFISKIYGINVIESTI